MKRTDRIIWAIAIAVLDLAIFVMPLCAFFIAYVLIARPPYVKAWIEKVYSD